MNVLIRYGMMSAAMAQLIFQRTASVLYHMNDIFLGKSSRTLNILALSIEKPNKTSKSARLTGCEALFNSLITRMRLEVGLTPFPLRRFSMPILPIFLFFVQRYNLYIANRLQRWFCNFIATKTTQCKRKLNTLNYYLFVSKQNPYVHFSTV